MQISVLSVNPDAYFNRRIVEECRQTAIRASVINPFRITAIGSGLFFGGEKIKSDIAFLRTPPYREEKDYIHIIGEILELNGVKTVNPPVAADICGNKIQTKLQLEKKGIKTLKWAFVRHTENLDHAVSAVGGYPVFLKTIFGTRGIGVVFCPCRETLTAYAQTMWAYNANIFVEEFATDSAGSTVRVLVSNGTIIGAVKNSAAKTENEGEEMKLLRSNFSRGGNIEVYTPDEEMRHTAIEAARATGASLAGVDFIKTSSGFAVLEINSSPGIKGFEKAGGFNAAEAVVKSFTA
ncbi:MAG: ATP-grasp domain-containing protein [Firmicutes bacterium]|nr:ATP-grasp domain-containing protein [Bacillota bacterium]